jgi:undecaprenyl-diphosphatase
VDFLTHYIQIVLLGIVEGVTEFLPISSTGHLLIAEALGLGHEPDVFNVVIQAGAILAVVLIYWNKIVDLFGNLDRPESRSYILKVVLAFCVTAVVSIVLVKHFKLKLPETLTPVAWATLLGGFVIFGIEFLSKKLYLHDDVSWFEAAMMGLAQVIAAAFPGASRSGSTIMTALALGMKRTTATEFSFLLGIPTMFAASALDLWRYRKDLTAGGNQLLIDITIGFIVSMVVAFFVVKWLLYFVRSHTFNGFAIYRVILGGVLLAALATHALPDTGTTTEPANSPAAKEAVPTMTAPATPTTNSDSTSSPSTSAAAATQAADHSTTGMAPPDMSTNAPAATMSTMPATNSDAVPVAPMTPMAPTTNAAPAP